MVTVNIDINPMYFLWESYAPKYIRTYIHVIFSSGQKISDLYSKVDCKWGCKDMIYILNLSKQFDRI